MFVRYLVKCLDLWCVKISVKCRLPGFCNVDGGCYMKDTVPYIIHAISITKQRAGDYTYK